MATQRNLRRITPLRVLLALAVALLVIGWFTARAANPTLAPRPGGPHVTIWLVDNGFHTDLAIPSSEIIAHGGPTAEAVRAIPARRWMLVGWGDRDFYTHTGFSTARVLDGLRALFGPNNPSVLHLDGFDAEPPRAFGGAVVPIEISPEGLSALLTRLDRSFAPPIRVTTRWGPGDGFFASRERFGVTHLCNHWTGQLLNAAGLADIPVIDTVPGGLRFSLRLHGVPRQTPLDEAPARP